MSPSVGSIYSGTKLMYNLGIKNESGAVYSLKCGGSIGGDK